MATNIDKNHVLDVSAIMAALLPDEKNSKQAKKIITLLKNPKNQFFAPQLLMFEAGNVLHSAVISHRITPLASQKIIQTFLQLPIQIQNINPQQTLQLSISHNLSFYDAAYLHLSQKFKCPLISLDKKLTKLSHA